MGTNEWVAIGTIATALFTGGSLYLGYAQRRRVRIITDPKSFLRHPQANDHGRLAFKIINAGAEGASGLTVRHVTPDQDVQLGSPLPVLPPGAETEIVAMWVIDRTGGESQPTPDLAPPVPFDASEEFFDISWLHPPRYTKRVTIRVPAQQLVSEHYRREGYAE